MGMDPDEWSRRNWARIPPRVRQDCLNELRDKVPADLLNEWCDQVRAGREIGSNDASFHLGRGMWVRNLLRNQLTDEELSSVVQQQFPEDFAVVTGWDDFYMGALYALVDQELKKQELGQPKGSKSV